MPQTIDTAAAPALNLQRRPVYGPVDPNAQAPAPRTFEQDKFRISGEARSYATAEDRQRDTLRRMVEGDDFASARPRQMGPFGGRRNVNPLGGVKVGTQLNDNFRLEGAASPRRGGTVGIGIRGVF